MNTIFKRNFLLIGIAGLLLANSVKAEQQTKSVEPMQVETLLRTDRSWDGQPYKSYPSGSPELSVLKITIPQNTELHWHTHPAPGVAYVLSGTLTVQKKETGETKLLTPGQVLPEMVEQLHRGYTGDEPVVLIVFCAGAKGLPFSEPYQE
jgi:quercetin dioxygenase-like cupin family protein